MYLKYFSARVLGEIYSNPPYHILRCFVADTDEAKTTVIKGDLAGKVSKGSILCFQGKWSKDKKTGKAVLEVKKSPVLPSKLDGEASRYWDMWNVGKGESKSYEIFCKLAEKGVSLDIINKIWYDIDSNPDLIYKDPWCLVEKGITFEGADTIARSLLGSDFDPECKERVKSSIIWSLLQGIKQGNCYLDTNTVFKDTAILTGVSDPNVIANSIKEMYYDSGKICMSSVGSDRALYLPSYYKMERDVCSRIKTRLEEPKILSDLTKDQIKSYSRYSLTDTQIEAIHMGLTERICIVTGLPGTGKTTILSTLCKILSDEKNHTLLIAPTGIASKRASDLTGLDAMTVHRAFGAGQPADEDKKKSDYEAVKKEIEEKQARSISSSIDPSSRIWKHNFLNPRTESVVIIDEASMIDLHLLWRVLQGVRNDCRIILVGDVEQLPPVGAGFVLSDMIESSVIPRIHLTEIFRQGEGSGVTLAAHKVHEGKMPSPNKDFVFMGRYNNYDILECLLEECKKLKYDEVDFHVMSPTHHGKVGVTNLNKELRAVLNPDIGARSIRIGNDNIREGDRVMITRNEYDLGVYNGDIGIIKKIDKVSVQVLFKGSKDQLLDIPRDQIKRLLRLAYATTVHKSQGLEYDTIIMPMSGGFSNKLLQRSLLYTAITRAKNKVILVGETECMALCVMNSSQSKKLSLLGKRLSEDIT